MERHQREPRHPRRAGTSLLVKETLNEKELAAIFANIKKAPKREVWLSDEKRPDSDIPPVPIPDKLKQSAGLTN